jgi:3-methyladenine DNA glycosylase AlkD
MVKAKKVSKSSRDMLQQIKTTLAQYVNEKRKESNRRFFKTGPGEYGEGDEFIGVSMPNIRKVSRKYRGVELEKVAGLMSSSIHEERMLGVIILVDKYEQAQGVEERKELLDFYLEHFAGVNNWDLVDTSAHKILGAYALENKAGENMLLRYARSDSLWERRLAIVGTFTLIRSGKFDLTLKIAKMLLKDTHDLIHKAVGWMLREVWKKNEEGAQKCEAFLRTNYKKIPRTTLRYAIEKMDFDKRNFFLKMKILS